MGTPVHLVASRGPSPGFQESHDRTEPLLECLQARNEHTVAYLGDHLALVRFVAVELRRPLDIRVITKGDRTGDHRGNVPADRQPGGVIAERERDGPVLVVQADQGLPVIAREREDPDAPDPVGRAVLDLARRQRRVPVPDGGEVPQQGPHLADRGADHGAREDLRHVNLLATDRLRFGLRAERFVTTGSGTTGADPPCAAARCQPRMFTALATTSAMAATEMADCSIIIIFAQRVRDVTSLAAKEMALVNDR